MENRGALVPTSNPTLCGSISARPSPFGVAMHNAGYRALDLPFTYVAFAIERTEEAVLAMRYLGIRGFGVSMPHKIEVMQYLDRLDETADEIGAVNTVVNDDGCLTGYNTDWTGAIGALQEQTSLHGKRVVVVGAGGAARAIVYGLARRGSDVTLYNRTVSKGQALAEALGVRFGGDLDALGAAAKCDVLVNATSVGFQTPGDSPIPPSLLAEGRIVMDVVFVPPVSRLVQDARAHGCVAIPGTRMLVHQAAYQFQLYTGREAPLGAMEQALLETIERIS
jgi:shikimate dehydrogenase